LHNIREENLQKKRQQKTKGNLTTDNRAAYFIDLKINKQAEKRDLIFAPLHFNQHETIYQIHDQPAV